jgi:hypothetical protein
VQYRVISFSKQEEVREEIYRSIIKVSKLYLKFTAFKEESLQERDTCIKQKEHQSEG